MSNLYFQNVYLWIGILVLIFFTPPDSLQCSDGNIHVQTSQQVESWIFRSPDQVFIFISVNLRIKSDFQFYKFIKHTVD